MQASRFRTSTKVLLSKIAPPFFELRPSYLPCLIRQFSYKPRVSPAAKLDVRGVDPQLNISSDGRVLANRDSETIFDYDDKFNLSSVNDPKKILSLLKQTNFDYSLNDLIYFLRRIVQLNEQGHLKIDVHNTPDMTKFVRKVKDLLKAETEKYPLIGSYAWCFWKLGMQNDTELWKLLGHYILEDKYYPILKEATFAIEGFTMLANMQNQEYIDRVYEKLERTCMLTIWEVNMMYYKRIAEGLVKVNRFTPQVFKRLEMHVMNNMSMEYSLSTMLDILFAFAKSGNGSSEFYNAVQFVIWKGHMFNRPAPFNLLWKDTPTNGAFVAKLIYTYSMAKERLPDLKFEPNFNAHVHQLVTSDKAKYNLEDLVTVMEHIGIFEYEDDKEIYEILDSKVLQIDENMYAEDMIRYIDGKVRRDYGGDYTKLPQNVVKFFDAYMLKNMGTESPERLYRYLAESELRGLLNGKEEYVAELIKDIAKRAHQYDFEAVCYMYWFSSKYDFILEGKKEELKPQIDLFRDYVKLYRSMKGDKVDLQSNYYKILEIFNEDDLSRKELPQGSSQ